MKLQRYLIPSFPYSVYQPDDLLGSKHLGGSIVKEVLFSCKPICDRLCFLIAGI